MSTLSSTETTIEPTQDLKEFGEENAVKVFAATKEHAKTLSAEIAQVYQAALGKGGIQGKGHDAYPDPDLFTAKGIEETLLAGERLIGIAQLEEGGKQVVVGAMVADRFSPHHVEFNSMAVPVARRGQKLGSHIVRGLADIVDQDKFTINCTELVTHSMASQAAHFHNGFRAICGFAFCHYPKVFFKDHPESVLWVTRFQGQLAPNLRRFRSALGRQLGRHYLDVKRKLIASQASGQVSLSAGRLDDESLNLLAEVLKERTAYVPKRYHDLVQSILFQFEDVLDFQVKSWVRPDVAGKPETEGNTKTDAEAETKTDAVEDTKAKPEANVETKANHNIDLKDGFAHSYITFNKDFAFKPAEAEAAIKSIQQLDKRFIKVCIPANTPEALKAADYFIEQGFVFHSYLPLYGYSEQTHHSQDEEAVRAAEFYDVLSLQWIKPSVVQENALPGETDSVIKLYGYPENLSGRIVSTIAHELGQINNKSNAKN